MVSESDEWVWSSLSQAQAQFYSQLPLTAYHMEDDWLGCRFPSDRDIRLSSITVPTALTFFSVKFSYCGENAGEVEKTLNGHEPTADHPIDKAISVWTLKMGFGDEGSHHSLRSKQLMK